MVVVLVKALRIHGDSRQGPPDRLGPGVARSVQPVNVVDLPSGVKFLRRRRCPSGGPPLPMSHVALAGLVSSLRIVSVCLCLCV